MKFLLILYFSFTVTFSLNKSLIIRRAYFLSKKTDQTLYVEKTSEKYKSTAVHTSKKIDSLWFKNRRFSIKYHHIMNFYIFISLLLGFVHSQDIEVTLYILYNNDILTKIFQGCEKAAVIKALRLCVKFCASNYRLEPNCGGAGLKYLTLYGGNNEKKRIKLFNLRNSYFN